MTTTMIIEDQQNKRSVNDMEQPRVLWLGPQLSMYGPKKLYKCLQFVCITRKNWGRLAESACCGLGPAVLLAARWFQYRGVRGGGGARAVAVAVAVAGSAAGAGAAATVVVQPLLGSTTLMCPLVL